MRLPYLQVSADLLDHVARDLAVLLNIGEPAAGWMALKLWQYGLSRATGDAPPDGRVEGASAAVLIEAAVGWPGERGAFISAALDPSVGLLEDLPTGFRIRGMDRYAATWEKNRKDKERRANAAKSPRASSANAAREQRASSESVASSPGKTQTQTQTQGSASQNPQGGARIAHPPADADCRDFGERMDAVFLAATGKPPTQSEPTKRKGLEALMRLPGWSEAEALRRWRIALSPEGKKRKAVASWLELAWRWDHFAADVEPDKPKPGAAHGYARTDGKAWTQDDENQAF